MEKLPKDFKKKWVKALRSGKYKQGKYYLYAGDGTYCCLGVAGIVNGCSIESMKGQSGTMEKIYREVTPVPLSYGEIQTLTGMNDSYGKTFEEIADYIEQNF